MTDGLNREGFTEPQAAQPPDLPAMTPGQAACVAWNSHYAEQHGIEARNEWAASDSRGRVAWEAAAIAGHNAFAFAAQPQPARELAAAMGEHPAIYARWYRSDVADATDAKVARLWKSASEADRQFWAQVVTERREDRAEMENQAGRGDRLEGQCEDLAAELDQLRERVARVAAALDAEALATAPSKKSQIQEDAARRVREALA